MSRMTLAVHSQIYSIHSFSPDAKIPAKVFTQEMFFVGKTKDELSVVVPAELKLESIEEESNWRCLEVVGPLGFSMTGILSSVSGALAIAGISIFAISTFDTDYILVKKDKLAEAITALKKKQFQITEY
ncbi:ACT domain-containing protein [Shewanella sp. D64]|uniref:ACT domain-containing protein n=1 Tax=unclassified Shewanella TaxID=196818 RepID=UPI0022BA4949|nr:MULTISPECIES: ACT domain-containing protein [unclassified Shewanella]MEC4724205.1 ACT domain-containing protein [Shewanella sp. D64]MEC4736225.1 ACT domain-containing protein [Shewanella sp. E94]WBJ97843.1 ACT domain-containing protein [Shewanella sp. MTB7]